MGGSGTVANKRVVVEGVDSDTTIPDASKPAAKGHGDEWPGKDLRNWKQETLFDSTFKRRKRPQSPPPAASQPPPQPSAPPISPSLLAEQRRARRQRTQPEA